MSYPPPPLPEKGKFRALYGWLNRLRDFCVSKELLPGEGILLQKTPSGTFISAPQTTRPNWKPRCVVIRHLPNETIILDDDFPVHVGSQFGILCAELELDDSGINRKIVAYYAVQPPFSYTGIEGDSDGSVGEGGSSWSIDNFYLKAQNHYENHRTRTWTLRNNEPVAMINDQLEKSIKETWDPPYLPGMLLFIGEFTEIQTGREFYHGARGSDSSTQSFYDSSPYGTTFGATLNGCPIYVNWFDMNVDARRWLPVRVADNKEMVRVPPKNEQGNTTSINIFVLDEGQTNPPPFSP